jgi:hypothetical protein
MRETLTGKNGPALSYPYRLAVYLVLALAAVEGLVAANGRMWRAYDPNPYRERLEGCREQAWDLVVIGGSPAMDGFDPAVLAGLRWQGHTLDRVYNLSLPLATTAEVFHAVEHGLPVPPRLLLYGITATDFHDDRVEPLGPRQLMDLRDVVRWGWSRPGAVLWCARHFVKGRLERLWKLWYYREGIRRWAADQAERCWPGVCPVAAQEARAGLAQSAALCSGHGFLQPIAATGANYDRQKASGAVASRFRFLENYRLGYLDYLDRLLVWAGRRGVSVALVDLPVPADLEERLYPQVFAAYRAALAEVQRARGVCVLHATRQAVGLTDADFMDQIHLNVSGTARLSAWVRNRLSQSDRPEEGTVAQGPGAGL